MITNDPQLAKAIVAIVKTTMVLFVKWMMVKNSEEKRARLRQ